MVQVQSLIFRNDLWKTKKDLDYHPWLNGQGLDHEIDHGFVEETKYYTGKVFVI